MSGLSFLSWNTYLNLERNPFSLFWLFYIYRYTLYNCCEILKAFKCVLTVSLGPESENYYQTRLWKRTGGESTRHFQDRISLHKKKFSLTNTGAFLIKTHGLAKQSNKEVMAELDVICWKCVSPSTEYHSMIISHFVLWKTTASYSNNYKTATIYPRKALCHLEKY